MRLRSLGVMSALMVLALAAAVTPATVTAQGGNTILKPADTQKLLPSGVYYKGQSAPTQLRNSGGVKFTNGSYVLATLVDNSGYSSDVATKYQAYFITEVPLTIEGKKLPAGVYGVGFIGSNQFVVTDVGGHDVLSVSAATDQAMKRPMPLEFTTGPTGGFRLYVGRKYVQFNK